MLIALTNGPTPDEPDGGLLRARWAALSGESRWMLLDACLAGAFIALCIGVGILLS